MRSTGRRRGYGPLAVALAAALLSSVFVPPLLAQPATGATMAQDVASACAGLTWAEMEAGFMGNVPKVTACRETVHAAFEDAVAMTAEDQEQVGLSFAGLLHEPVEAGAPAPFPAVSYILISEFEGWLATYCTPVGVAPWAEGTIETCTASVRLVGVGSQALSPDINAMVINIFCSAIRGAADWRTDIVAVVDELAARAATGTDPVMQASLDDVAIGTRACP